MPLQAQLDEAAYISGVNVDGTIPTTAYWGWDGGSPPTYNSGYTDARKWGANTAKTGATVSCYFDTHAAWTAAEMQIFRTALALWSAVANVTFTDSAVIDGANITFLRGSDGSATTISSAYDSGSNGGKTGGTHLLTIAGSTVSIDTTLFPLTGPAGLMTALHEIGHAIGLGHAGPYNSSVSPETQQNGAYDNLAWSVMSYISSSDALAPGYDPATAAAWNGAAPDSFMPLDILALQNIYGVAQNTPLAGGQVFGFNSNIDGNLAPVFDFTQNTTPVVTLWDKGTGNTLNISGFAAAATVNLNPGTFSSVDGLTRNIAIAFNTAIDTLVCGNGNTSVTCNDDGDAVLGGAGNDTITTGAGSDVLNGGAGTDTVVYTQQPDHYSVVHNPDGSYAVTGQSGTDTLTNIEQASFGSQTLSLAQFQAQSFQALDYIASYGDLIKAFGDNAQWGMNHYFNNGLAEGRSITFNPLNYIASYGDLIRAFGDNQTSGVEHYIKNGYDEGRKVTFDPLAYLCSYGDLMRAFGDNQIWAAEHYINNGYAEGRTVTFNVLNYIASYGDLIQAFGDNVTLAEEHYIKNGYTEGRTVSFDPVAYLLSNTDLGRAGFTASGVAEHYINNGYAEHRSASGLFGTEQTNHALAVGGTVSDIICTSSDKDWFGISVAASQTYTFTLTGADGAGGSLADPFLSVFDVHGLALTYNDNTGSSHDSSIRFTALATGTVYLVATASDSGTGTYKLIAAPGG